MLRYNAYSFPNQIALLEQERNVTYGQLNYEVNSFASGLQALNIKKGDHIACILRNSIVFVAVYFAAAKIGAVLVPFNYFLKPTEWENLVGHCNPKLIICDTFFTDSLMSIESTRQIPVIWAGENTPHGAFSYEEIINNRSKLEVHSPVKGKDVCNIIYTSGTTGSPKGVIRTHSNNLWANIQMAHFSQYQRGEINLFIGPPFTMRFINIFSPAMFSGAEIILMEEFDPEIVIRTIEEKKVNRLFLPPAYWEDLINHERFNSYDKSNLKYIITGTYTTPAELKQNLQEAFPSASIFEIWGATEGGLIGSCPEDIKRKPASIGLPMAFNDVKILDERLQEVPHDKIGELAIRGPSVSDGYYKNTKTTGESLGKSGWFMTGDLARADKDGYLYIVDRKSEVINIGNFKIYPGEIQHLLNYHPKVMESLIFGLPSSSNAKFIAAAIVPRNGIHIPADEINNYINGYIANYKKPKVIYFVDELPKTATDKIIRCKEIHNSLALRKPDLVLEYPRELV
ncbi:long-chain-fatty-acid--CoA ligase [Desulfocucumis palustris]|uniref:Long-chain-fatty-acid--CoA ligase n=1 Tax=Desulfocucumis palustris TaxID=1898651 RepID=A0A2L2XE15_9FIRM|nr:class I adenylate-forming enzyme family protein [Desulfocucumis palustris]GBF32476.1 long-chain-fatty-acid--CoA ligase [Desulfocucumis palustris]